MLCAALTFALNAAAQPADTGVTLTVPPGGLGLDGVIRPGSWMPLRLSLDNASAEDRDIVLSWVHHDSDGDRVAATRRVTLTRQRPGQRAWLYAAAPMTTSAQTRWEVTAADAATGRRLAAITLEPDTSRLVTADTDLVAVTSNADLGLNDYQRHETRHAPLRLVRGLSLDRSPDRWMGLSALSAFVWTRDLGGDPADPLQTSEASLSAMREWVYRGGHLVVVLPAVGQTWTASPLADMLPVTAAEMRSTGTADWPRWLGGLRQEDRPPLSLTTFDLADTNTRATVLLRGNDGEPVAVAARYGFGRVTLLGLDLTQQPLQAEAMPYGPDRMWNHLFGWVSPVFSSAAAEGMVNERQLVRADRLDPSELGAFIPSRIAMTGTVGAVLVGALGVFVAYWLLAGWLVQPLLKLRGLERYSWVAFVGVVVVFTGVAWGGAALLRPARLTLSHFSVVDLDGNGGPARVHSALSVFVPRFGPAELAVPDETLAVLGGEAHNTLAASGLTVTQAAVGFADTQEYAVDAASPHALPAAPMRATTKELRVRYLGPVDAGALGLPAGYRFDASPLTVGEDGWPVGRVTHHLPEALRNVLIVFCRGEGYGPNPRQLEPWVWTYADDDGRWSPGETLELGGEPAGYEALVRGLAAYGEERDYGREGYLGRLLGQHKGAGPGDAAVAVDESVVTRELVMLSFFDALPPPNFRKGGFPRGFALRRTLGQGLDLTPLLHGRRLIILGQLPKSPLPAPFTVDGDTPPGDGWTMVRWVCDF